MSGASKIEWTDATWNPLRGCQKISPGCKHCYAETFAVSRVILAKRCDCRTFVRGIRSCETATIRQFPSSPFVRFFEKHGSTTQIDL